jgi:hypothetical protein
MRVAFIPWVALAAVIVGSGEIALPCESDISLGEHGRAESLESRCGPITLGRDSRVRGDVETDRGEIVLEPGSEVTGDISSESGAIRIDAAHVGGRITTTSGDIQIGPDSRIEGGILVDKRGVIGLSLFDLRLGVPVGRSTPPRVVIGPRATVAGVLRFKRKVELLVSESAMIGRVEGAKPVMFATQLPPQ